MAHLNWSINIAYSQTFDEEIPDNMSREDVEQRLTSMAKEAKGEIAGMFGDDPSLFGYRGDVSFSINEFDSTDFSTIRWELTGEPNGHIATGHAEDGKTHALYLVRRYDRQYVMRLFSSYSVDEIDSALRGHFSDEVTDTSFEATDTMEDIVAHLNELGIPLDVLELFRP